MAQPGVTGERSRTVQLRKSTSMTQDSSGWSHLSTLANATSLRSPRPHRELHTALRSKVKKPKSTFLLPDAHPEDLPAIGASLCPPGSTDDWATAFLVENSASENPVGSHCTKRLLDIAEKEADKKYPKSLRSEGDGQCYLKTFPKSARSRLSKIVTPFPPLYLVLALRCRFKTGCNPDVNLGVSSDGLHVAPVTFWIGNPSEETLNNKNIRDYLHYLVGANPLNALADHLSGTIHRDGVAGTYVGDYVNNITQALSNAPAHIPKHLHGVLTKSGVPFDPLASGSHPHPAHKAIENHMLHQHVSSHMVHPTTCMFMKRAKFNSLRGRNNNAQFLVNENHTVKDLTRYEGTTIGLPKTLDTEHIFLHDSGHYYTQAGIADFFAKYKNLKSVMFTAVLPVELLVNRPSFCPELYTLSVNPGGKSFAYTLEGRDSTSYVQPLSTLSWLHTGQIKVFPAQGFGASVMTLHVSRLDSINAHQLYLVTRESISIPDAWNTFDSPDEVELPVISGVHLKHSNRWVPREPFKQTFLHAYTLSTKKGTSTASKARVYASKPEYAHIDADTWLALASVCDSLSRANATLPGIDLDPSAYATLKREIRSWLGPRFPALAALSGGAGLSMSSLGIFFLAGNITSMEWASSSTLALITSIASNVGAPLAFVAAGIAALVFANYLARPLDGAELQRFMDHITHKGVLKLKLETTCVYNNIDGISTDHPDVDLPPSGGGGSPYGPIRNDKPSKYPHVRLLTYPAVANDPEDDFDLMSFEGECDPDHSMFPDSVSEADTIRPAKSLGTNQLEPPKNDPDAVEVDDIYDVSNAGSVHETPSKEPTQEEPFGFHEVPKVNPINASNLKQPAYDPDSQVHSAEVTQGESPTLTFIPPVSQGTRPLRESFNLTPEQVLEPDGYVVVGENLGYHPNPPAMDCLLRAVHSATGIEVSVLWTVLCSHMDYDELVASREQGLTTGSLVCLAYHFQCQFRLLGEVPEGHPPLVGLKDASLTRLENQVYDIYATPGHWSAFPPDGHKGTIHVGGYNPTMYAPFDGEFRGPHHPAAQFMLDFKDNHGNKAVDKWFRYRTHPARAKAYARDLKSGVTGTILSQEGKRYPKSFTAAMDASLDIAKPRYVGFSMRVGAASSSKSHPLRCCLSSPAFKKNFMRGNSVKISVPRVKQRQDWASALDYGTENWKIGTFETAITKSATILIIDELSQMTPGYIDYCLVAMPSIRYVVAAGDLCQGFHHDPNQDATTRSLIPEILYFKRLTMGYRFYMYDIPQVIAKAFGIPTLSKTKGFIRIAQVADYQLPTLCASDMEARSYSALGCRQSYTFAGAQGSRFDEPVQIVLSTAACTLVDPGLIVSAFTRSKAGVVLILSTSFSQVKAASQSPILAPVFDLSLTGDFLRVFQGRLAGVKILRHGQHVGGSEPDELRIPYERASDPLRMIMSDVQGAMPEITSDPDDFEPGPPTSLPLDAEEFVIDSLYDMRPREERELWLGNERSGQFPDDGKHTEQEGYTGVEEWFPRQSSQDQVTKITAVQKRLRFATAADNLKDYKGKEYLGPHLFKSFLETSGLPKDKQVFDFDLFTSCIAENDFVKLTSKTQAVLLNNAERADPDWRFTYVRIFIKGQLKAKKESLMSDFKAGQTLASFQDSVILVTGPMTRYIVHKFNRGKRSTLYTHGGRSPRQLAKWCQDHWSDLPIHTTNDYTAFDLSQRGEAMAVEVLYLKYEDFPDWIVEYYVYLKTNMSCQYGDLAVLRHTGEGPTWFFNCVFNISVSGLQYELGPDQPMAISGDDEAICGNPAVKESWPFFDKRLTLVAKTQRVKLAEFCSWYLTSKGCIKNPALTLLKLRIARDRGEEHKVRDSYAAEIAVGYHMGDHLFDYLDEVDMAAQSVLVRHFVVTLPTRFALLFSRRSLEEVLSPILSAIGKKAYDAAVSLASSEVWSLQSSATRHAAKLLGGYGHYIPSIRLQ